MLASAKKNQTASAATEIRHKKKLQVGKPNDRMLMEFFPQILHSSGCWKLLEDQSILSSTPVKTWRGCFTTEITRSAFKKTTN